MRVDICIATYRRPQGLLRLLAALERQRFRGPAPECRAIVVDNDERASARSVCEELRPRLALPIRYAVEKRRGIAPARNAALALALGNADFAAFVDDDEEPAPDWLDRLLETQQRYEADVVAGPCRPDFAAGAPAWIAEGGFFARPEHPDGALLSHCYTHNALVRCTSLAVLGALFDERLALSGGEDVELFERLASRGARIVWSAEAVVFDCVPSSRANARWILRRAFRTGASSALIARLRGEARARLLVHAAGCLGKAALRLLAAPARGRPLAAPAWGRVAAVRALELACWGAGRAWGAAGGRFEAYRNAGGD